MRSVHIVYFVLSQHVKPQADSVVLASFQSTQNNRDRLNTADLEMEMHFFLHNG